MENSWQRKCGKMWQSAAASVVSSSQEPQDQILNAGYHFHSYVQGKPTLLGRRMAPEAPLSWTSSMSSYNLDHTERGSSLLSLLSGSQCITPAEVPISSFNASGFASGSEVSHLTSGMLSQNLNSQNVETGSDLCSVLSSKARVSANHGSKAGPSNVLQDAYINLEKLELPKEVMHPNPLSNGNRLPFPPNRVGYANGSIPSNAWKLHSSHNSGVFHIPEPSVSCSSSTLLIGCPHVFCLNLSGDLLLSNTGLLGVVCSCHGYHMSITKFMEHSGLCNMNPGDAVRLDSGETIAQWRKVYFHKFGIKIPEDHCGWDWPEGVSVTAGLMKHCPTVPSVSKNSDLSNQDSTFASLQSFNHVNGTRCPRNFHAVQPHLFACNEKHGNSSSLNNLHYVPKNQKITFLTSESSTMSNSVGVKGVDNVCQAVSSYILPASKSGDPFVFPTYLQSLETLGKGNDIGRKSGSLVQRDIVSSNVELRLGQPSEQGQSSSNTVPLAFGSHIIGDHGQLPNSFFLEQNIPKCGSMSIEEKRKHGYLSNCLSGSSRRAEQSQLAHANKICGVPNALPNAFQFEQFKDDAAGGSVISRSVSHLKYPLEGSNSRSINDVVSGCHVMVPKVNSESPVANNGQFSCLLYGGGISDRVFGPSLPVAQKHENCENGRCAIGSLQGTAESTFGSHTKSKAVIWSFGGGENGSDRKVYSAGRDETSAMCHVSRGMTDEPDRVNTSNYFAQPLYPAQNGLLFSNASRSINSSVDFRRALPTQTVRMGFSATNSLDVQSLDASSMEENINRGPNLMDENVRISVLQHMLELPSPNHSTTSFKAIPEQDGLRNFCGKSQAHASSSVSDKRISEMNYASEVALQSFQSANFLSNDNAKLPSLTDKPCHFSVISQGRYCHGKDAEIKNQSASEMQATNQLFLRLAGTGSISPSSEAEKCSQGMQDGCVPSKFSFAVQTDSWTGRYNKNGESILAKCKDQERYAGNMMTTLLGPKMGESCGFSEKVDSFGHNENMMQNTKKVECNSFLWRDVPQKVVGKCSLACVENSADSCNRNVECKDALTAGADKTCFDESANNVGSFKEQETSNVSSGGSAPVVTQASIEVNNKDSSTVDAEDSRYAGNPIGDEGSGIERCWSSDDGVDSERKAEFSGFASKFILGHKTPFKPLLSKPCRSLIDELRFRDSLRLKMQKQSQAGSGDQGKGALIKKSERDFKIWKRRPVKWKKLTSSFSPSAVSVVHNDAAECASNTDLHPNSVKDKKIPSQCDQVQVEGCPCDVGQHIKRRPTLCLSTDISQDRNVCRIHHVEEEKTDKEMNLNADNDYSESMGRKRMRLSCATHALKQICGHRSNSVDSEVAVKETVTNCNVNHSQPRNISQRPQRPVIYGKYGVIANANPSKPAKILSLKKLLKAPDTHKMNLSSIKLLRKESLKGRYGPFYESCKIKEEIDGKGYHGVPNELNLQHSMDESETACSNGSKQYEDLARVMKKRRCIGDKIEATHDGCQIIELRRKYKEVRKRSLHELITKDNNSSYVKFPIMKNVKPIPQTKSAFPCRLAVNADDNKISAEEMCNAKISSKHDNCPRDWNLNLFCCVCGSSSKDENNDFLECSRCMIKVHQACYGISKVPKVHWFCRPCKTSSKNIVCVLCGYGGGAMTRALRSHNTVKSLLQAWNVTAESSSHNPGSSKSSEYQIKELCSSNSLGYCDRVLVIRPAHKDLPLLASGNTELSEHKDSISILSPSCTSVERNSITSGVLDSTVKQWVHMVCGLWTPGTRCPNVYTMSAFDVSGACTSEPDVVCSICQRPGGSCIWCRVIGCNVRFHPWCAHQKGLLQSEVEGNDNESVGFYGRCLRHAINCCYEPECCRLDSGDANHSEKKITCARTEGYKGRKRDGVHYNLLPHCDGHGGSLFVPQEQLDAWIHINRQKPSKKGPLKLSTSDIEHDRRKEYARYKQSRGWKHLVVYKSGIHGLGLYTSQFISCGAMVVEYVGEIVGLRVADKRETEYQSGKKMQYKSACYFFRIDKEYIIDATRKGGIARFVNHSCQPNCVAEIICVRNEKKVVFFAERDIYPGEEITYDYHFNHEDEGKKIPCYCNSKNCRRYLN